MVDKEVRINSREVERTTAQARAFHEGNTLLERAKERISSIKAKKIKVAMIVLAATMIPAPMLYGKHNLQVYGKLDTNKHQTILQLRQNGVTARRETEFKSRKYDIQQILEVSNPNYSSRVVSCTIRVPAASREFGQAFLLNGLTNRGYMYQIGPAHGIFLDTVDDPKFDVAYMVADPTGRKVYITTQKKNVLEPNTRYKVEMRIEGNKVIAEVSDLSGNPIQIISGPAFGSEKFIGGTFTLQNGSGLFTGVMTEIISPRKDVATGKASYHLFSPMPSIEKDYALSSGINDSVLGGDKAFSEHSYPASTEEVKKKNARDMVMGNYLGSLRHIEVKTNGKTVFGYSFTTSSK